MERTASTPARSSLGAPSMPRRASRMATVAYQCIHIRRGLSWSRATFARAIGEALAVLTYNRMPVDRGVHAKDLPESLRTLATLPLHGPKLRGIISEQNVRFDRIEPRRRPEA
jgi:hypothetical protein